MRGFGAHTIGRPIGCWGGADLYARLLPKHKRRMFDTAPTAAQKIFLGAKADEVLFGGAAGGGKSYAQLLDARRYALRYPGSKQLVLRRSYRELELSLIREALRLYPREEAAYNGGRHMFRFGNGSIIDFGYCGRPTPCATRAQSMIPSVLTN